MNIDESFSRALFTYSKNSIFLTKLAIFCGSFLIWLMLGFSLGRVFWNILFLVPIILLPWGVTFFISSLVKRPRPFESEHYKPIIKLFVYTNSFPSAHATIAFALVAAFLRDGEVWPFMLIAAFLVGLGRLMVGVHYLSDVLVGACIGFGLGYTTLFLFY